MEDGGHGMQESKRNWQSNHKKAHESRRILELNQKWRTILQTHESNQKQKTSNLHRNPQKTGDQCSLQQTMGIIQYLQFGPWTQGYQNVRATTPPFRLLQREYK